MKERETIRMTDSTAELLTKMSEGNPGALRVCMEIINSGSEGDNGLITLLHLDDMNIRGSQIWVAYKDFAKQDIKVLIKAIGERNVQMLKAVNDEAENTGGHLAVLHGASRKRPARMDAHL